MRTHWVWLAISSLGCSAVGQAQTVAPIGLAQSEVRASVGVTIPLGSGQTSELRPRVELTLARDQIDYSGGRQSQQVGGSNFGQLQLGRSLDQDGRWAINGRVLPQESAEGRRGISTLGVVGISVGVVLLAGVVALAVDPPLNNLFESTR